MDITLPTRDLQTAARERTDFPDVNIYNKTFGNIVKTEWLHLLCTYLQNIIIQTEKWNSFLKILSWYVEWGLAKSFLGIHKSNLFAVYTCIFFLSTRHQYTCSTHTANVCQGEIKDHKYLLFIYFIYFIDNTDLILYIVWTEQTFWSIVCKYTIIRK